MNTKVLFAVLKRNFVSYFAGPLGYVFICVFVELSVLAAFWSNEFFNMNLANPAQLNAVFPLIMLVFAPAIAMSIWADERRQGTDELLLTMPAGDLEIVVGKYLAATAIYSVSLLFSLLCTFGVLRYLGDPDVGLLLTTYLGYWFVGVAMLGIAMVASFLTSNLTVAFALGAIFNAPAVFAVYADSFSAYFGTFFGERAAGVIKQWSIGGQFQDFGRGVITLPGIVYFPAIAAVSIYLSMILIGRRHWSGNRGKPLMAVHYTLRVGSLAAIGVGLTTLAACFGGRIDGTAERLTSLSPETIKLLDGLRESDKVVRVEAFITPNVPELYVQTRLNLINTLREVESRSGGKVLVKINATELFGDEETRAAKKYGITPRPVLVKRNGIWGTEEIFMTVAVSCGTRRVPPVFIDRRIPVEYELVRSVATVTQEKRKRIGILTTDAALLGQPMNFMMPAPPKRWAVVDELEKAYDVVRVDPSAPITEKYDCLLAVQPSSLDPNQMKHFIAAVRAGQPTAIFEDPCPVFRQGVPGTADPKRPPQQMPFMMGQGAAPKGRIQELWDLLGVEFAPAQVVFHDYTPPKLQEFPKEFVFVDRNCGAKEPFNDEDVVSSKLQQLLFPFPGYLAPVKSKTLKFIPLVRTSERTGTIETAVLRQTRDFANFREPKGISYVLAARITGEVPAAPADDAASKDGKAKEKPATSNINVVLAPDFDLLEEQFFRYRERGDLEAEEEYLSLDNVTFVLNVVDSLAGDNRFVEIRKRRPQHRTLTRVDEATAESRKMTEKSLAEIAKRLKEADAAEEKKIRESIAELQKGLEKEQMTAQDVAQRLEMALKQANDRKRADLENLERDLQKKRKDISRDLDRKIRSVQTTYKLWAVALPPIPPLVVALVFLIIRRAREREGVSRSRLRS